MFCQYVYPLRCVLPGLRREDSDARSINNAEVVALRGFSTKVRWPPRLRFFVQWLCTSAALTTKVRGHRCRCRYRVHHHSGSNLAKVRVLPPEET